MSQFTAIDIWHNLKMIFIECYVNNKTWKDVSKGYVIIETWKVIFNCYVIIQTWKVVLLTSSLETTL